MSDPRPAEMEIEGPKRSVWRNLSLVWLVPFAAPPEELVTMHGNGERVAAEEVRRGVRVLYEAVVEVAEQIDVDQIALVPVERERVALDHARERASVGEVFWFLRGRDLAQGAKDLVV